MVGLWLGAWTVDSARAQPTDPHEWLEQVQDPRALGWVDQHNDRTNSQIRADLRYASFRDEALAILTADDRLPLGQIHHGQVYSFWQDQAHVRGVWRRSPLKAFRAGQPQWEVLLDYDALAAQEGRNWISGSIVCLSPRHRPCMVELSDGGRDAGSWREFDPATGSFVADGFMIPEAKSLLAWVDPDTLLVSTDTGPGSLTTSGYPRTVRAWSRGTALAETPLVAEADATDVWLAPRVEHSGADTHIFFQRGLSYFRTERRWTTDWRKPASVLPIPAASVLDGVLDGRAILTLREPWQVGENTYAVGSVVAFELRTGASELVLAPQVNESIEDVLVGSRSLLVQLTQDVAGRALRLVRGRDGLWATAPLALPDNGVVSLVSVGGRSDEAFVAFESLTSPPALMGVDRRNQIFEILASAPAFDPTDIVVERRFATSDDGTRIPYFVMGRKDVLAAGPAPTIQYAYGGFLAATLPEYFSESARPQHGAFAGRIWVTRGGVLVLCGIRGGSEYGPAWHAAALRENRHRAFEDFYAISRDLIDRGVTTPAQLGALGRSNGGLLMGVIQTQHPELYGAIVNGVPLFDMLRYTKLGAGASWIAEYGDPDLPDDRPILEAYSPYQRLIAGVRYPPVLFYTSTLDDRVHPGHARKAVARMEELQHEVYLFENREGGHGGTANQEELADLIALQYTFFARELMR